MEIESIESSDILGNIRVEILIPIEMMRKIHEEDNDSETAQALRDAIVEYKENRGI